MFISAIFRMTKIQNQPNFPLLYNRCRKQYICSAIIYYSAIKQNKILPLEATWMSWKEFFLREMNQVNVDLTKVDIIEVDIRMVITGSWGGYKGEEMERWLVQDTQTRLDKRINFKSSIVQEGGYS
jgi:hypothetical protein